MDISEACEVLGRTRAVANGLVTMAFRLGHPPLALISGVHAVPFLNDGSCLLIRSKEWGWMIPGGTCEPGEAPLETVVREMREEAGAVLWSYVPIGADWCHSTAPPYRPHLPYPDFCRVWGWGDGQVVGSPDPLADGETVEEVRAFTVAEAVATFVDSGEMDAAAMVLLAADHRGRTLASHRSSER